MTTKNKPQHSPLPWTFHECRDSYTVGTLPEDRTRHAIGAPVAEIVVTSECGIDSDEGKANAALIVRAVNAHEALIFALKLAEGVEAGEAWAIEWCEDRRIDGEATRSVVGNVRRAALKLAQGDR